jgi:hypothetical protein
MMYAVLALVTLLEIALFGVRRAVPHECIVPALLGLSSVKFAMVMDWYLRRGSGTGWRERAVPTAFVALGGTTLALIAAYGS